MRFSRGVAVQPTCMRCHAAEETITHCLRDCSGAARIWHSLGFDKAPNFFLSEASIWVCENASSDNNIRFLAAVFSLGQKKQGFY